MAKRAIPWTCALTCAAGLAATSPVLAQTVKPQLVAKYAHDPDAFTEGLLLHDGRFFESTGLTGRSSLRRVVPANGAVELSVPLASDLFGEGLALAGDRLIELTWQNHVALVYDLDFDSVGSFDYEGEGWGLCHDGSRLVMSDGSSRLFFRDPQTFELLGSIEVTRAGTSVTRLNELECVGNLVYANVWLTDTIVRIDPRTGAVLTTIDASNLLSAAEAANADVLNGIAFDPTTGHFFLTGKLWPKLFEVTFDFDPYGGPPMADAGSDAELDSGTSGSGGADGGIPQVDAANGSGGVIALDAGLPDKPVRSDEDSSCACRFSTPKVQFAKALVVLGIFLASARCSARRRQRRMLA